MSLRNLNKIVAICIFVMAGLAFYYFVDPAVASFSFKCPFHLLTGLDCPSCGSQRAFHALLHGEVLKAVKFNPFLFFSLPYLLFVIWGSFANLPGSSSMKKIFHSQIAIYSYLVAMIIWWIIRNLSVFLEIYEDNVVILRFFY